jgi:hypothetical protein
VVTHTVPDGWAADGESMRVVTDGVASAIAHAKAAAGVKLVAVATPRITDRPREQRKPGSMSAAERHPPPSVSSPSSTTTRRPA